MAASDSSSRAGNPASPPIHPQTLELVCRGTRFPCKDGDVIGREGTVGTAALADARMISRQHLLISWQEGGEHGAPGGWFIKLASAARNVTALDGRPMQRDLWHGLGPGEHRLVIVEFEFGLHVAEVAREITRVIPGGAPGHNPVASLEELRRQFGMDGLFHLVTDHTRDLIAIIDSQGRRVWNNAAYFTCLGYQPEEIRHSYSMTEIHPDDLPLVQQTFADSMRTGTGSRIEYRMRHRDQRWVYLESQASVVKVPGASGQYLVLVARDITVRKEAEQKAVQHARRLVERAATLARLTQLPGIQEGNLESCFAEIVEAAAKHFDCERASVWLFSPKGDQLVCQDLFERGPVAHSRGEAWPVSACGQFLAALRVKRCLAIDSAFTDERLTELRPIYLFSHRVSSFLAARICLGSEVLGVLVLERTDVIEHWSLEDQNFASSLADVLLAAVQARTRAEAFAELQKSQRLLAAELTEANNYVRALLPAPLSGEVEIEWRFLPCTSLAGDGFGYQWLDERRLAVFLLDAAGHGVGAALLCTSALNLLRARALPDVDFGDPAAVLRALNRVFDMEKQGDMFFTIWYGVYDREKREVVYAAAGHPAPVLLGSPTGSSESARTFLGTKGPMIGANADALFATATAAVPPQTRLYIFSDGAFEILKPDGTAWGFEHFVEQLGGAPRPGFSELDSLLQHIQETHGSPALPDDFSILRLVFR